jgi:hypothetical protein
MKGEKIIEVVKHHIEGLVTGRRTAEQVMPELVREVSSLLLNWGGDLAVAGCLDDVQRGSRHKIEADTRTARRLRLPDDLGDSLVAVPGARHRVRPATFTSGNRG